MKTYYIHTFATEDQPDIIASYDYNQYKEVIATLKESGRSYTTWTE